MKSVVSQKAIPARLCDFWLQEQNNLQPLNESARVRQRIVAPPDAGLIGRRLLLGVKAAGARLVNLLNSELK